MWLSGFYVDIYDKLFEPAQIWPTSLARFRKQEEDDNV